MNLTNHDNYDLTVKDNNQLIIISQPGLSCLMNESLRDSSTGAWAIPGEFRVHSITINERAIYCVHSSLQKRNLNCRLVRWQVPVFHLEKVGIG